MLMAISNYYFFDRHVLADLFFSIKPKQNIGVEDRAQVDIYGF